ncbi:MAG: helix-turn-helix domain-containing protein [Rikenellaceae bacterium]
MDIKELNSVDELNKRLGVKTLHPLITLLDFSKIDVSDRSEVMTYRSKLYYISIKSGNCGKMIYGRNTYDFQDNTMVFVAPNQIVKVEREVKEGDECGAYNLFFHPDLLKDERLATTIGDYNFFGYNVSEALHLSPDELRVVRDCFERMSQEMSHSIDKYSKKLIISNLELLLWYCQRFYDRQFVTRDTMNKDILSKFEVVVNEYFATDMQSTRGLPTVKYCAERLSLSPNYLGDLIKRDTGHSAQEHLQHSIVERAKVALTTTSKSVSEISYSLGFEYPHYFSRLFKKRVGVSPKEYRANLN